MFVISVAQGKGGVGKTTTAISLGAAFVECGKRVLIIDIDPQEHVQISFSSHNGRETKFGMDDVLLDNVPISKAIQKTNINDLFYITSGKRIVIAEQYLPVHKNYFYTIKRNLNDISVFFDMVIIDCPPLLGALTMNAIVAANLVIIPTLPDAYSMVALGRTIKWINQIQRKYNSILHYRVLVTMYNKGIIAHNMIFGKLTSILDGQLFNTVVSTNTKLRESQIAGIPIINYAPNAISAEQYRLVAKEVLDYVQSERELREKD
jgi:chromosome partitioning protein